ncbi:metal ABC transporter solute-binding protein, Zn/Mn family [Bacteroidota bacterium]
MKFAFLFLLILLSACSEQDVEETGGKIKAAVSTITYADFVKQVGGENVDIIHLIPAGVDPHDFEPNFNRVKKIADADIYFRIGEIFTIENNWIQTIKAANENIEIADCSDGINIRNNNPHIWLGLEEVKTIVENICRAFVKIDTASADYYKHNKEVFISRIDSLNDQLKQDFDQLTKKEVLVYHPAWRYFLSRYGLEEISIEKDGKEPKAKDLHNLIDYAKLKGIKAIFIEPQFDIKAASTIADEIGAQIVMLNPIPEDFFVNINDIREKFMKYLK